MLVVRIRPRVRIALQRFGALVLDLDGVVTNTAVVHARAWKRALDELFAELARGGVPWRPFDPGDEYRRHVDGKPRRDGIRSVLAARGMTVPEGRPGDDAGAFTIHGVAARKQRYFLEQLAGAGVAVYADARRLLERARACGVRTAVVSASENCRAVLDAARATSWFDVRVDGLDLRAHGLRGKPAPDAFVEAARRLGVEPARGVVLEDAVAGVRAGRAGGFGLVIGVARVGGGEVLRVAGADEVVRSLDELALVPDRASVRP